MKAFYLILCCFFFLNAQKTYFENSNFLESVPPENVMDFYKSFSSPYLHINIAGYGDGGDPIHEVIISKKAYKSSSEHKGEMVYFILNGIHSGEAGGIDASQMLVRDHLKKLQESTVYDDIILVIIPVYNVGGHKKYSPYNRINQNGPVNMGFRGNARNYDLNRDFIKMDTRNMEVFAKLFHSWKPSVFMDNHCTDGADYQYAMTYMINHLNLDPKPLRDYINNDFLPDVETQMVKKNYPMAPYVSLASNGDIKMGLNYYKLSPRFSTTYASLFNTISILVETHMLKAYKDRVLSNLAIMESVISNISKNTNKIKKVLNENMNNVLSKEKYTIRWELDREKYTMIDFKGYEYQQVEQEFFNGPLVKYDRDKPVTFKLKYHNQFKELETIDIPQSYIIPKAWHNIITKLKANNVMLEKLKENKEHDVEMYRFDNVEFQNRPFEGRVMIKNFDYAVEKTKRAFEKGDFVIKTNQASRLFILESLEPKGLDSFFNWGFFNTILQQKEYFDPYIFVDKIDKILKDNPNLKEAYEKALEEDPSLKKSGYARMNYIYKRSKYYEKHSHMLYPIARIMK
jgi:hypothetical protein